MAYRMPELKRLGNNIGLRFFPASKVTSYYNLTLHSPELIDAMDYTLIVGKAVLWPLSIYKDSEFPFFLSGRGIVGPSSLKEVLRGKQRSKKV